MPTPHERWAVRELAHDITSGKIQFDPGRVLIAGFTAITADDVIALAAELSRLDMMRETWECVDCGREWCGPSYAPCQERVGEKCRATARSV